MIQLTPENATVELVHTRLTEITTRHAEFWGNDWNDESVFYFVVGQFESVIGDIESSPAGVSFDKDFLVIDITIQCKYGEFRIDYATGKVHEWKSNPQWDHLLAEEDEEETPP